MFNSIKFDYFSDSVFRGQVGCEVGCTMVKKLSPNWTSFKCFYYKKKAAVVSNFCLIGKIRHNFLVPRVIELGCQTFMLIQTLDLHRVYTYVKRFCQNYHQPNGKSSTIGDCFIFICKWQLLA